MIKILAVGNSFSLDATAFIEPMCDEIFVRNLYIGGCSLETHCRMADTGEKGYVYQQNGETVKLSSFEEALTAEAWDFVTVQQVSGLSGVEESYYPDLTKLLAYIRKFTSAEIVLHETWAYETGSDHPDFARYGNDKKEMHRKIKETYAQISRREKLKTILTGDLIEKLRGYDFYNVNKGGISHCRDGYHLSFYYGRMAAAELWIKFFTGKAPSFFERGDLSEGYALIKKCLGEME